MHTRAGLARDDPVVSGLPSGKHDAGKEGLDCPAGTEIALVSAQNGTFWTTQALVVPLTVRASRCPDDRAMPGVVQAAGASCNLGGCHDSDMRIALP